MVRKKSIGPATARRNALRSLQRQRLRHQLAQNHVQAGDQDEGDADGDRVRVGLGMGNSSDGALDQRCQQRLAYPSEGQAGDGDP